MVDMIYADPYGHEVDMLPWFDGDFSLGKQNSFSLKAPPALGIGRNWYLMVPETEYGGIVDGTDVDTSKRYITLTGRTWHGMLQGNVVEPDAGQAYYVCTGDLNEVYGRIIERLGLSERMMADPSPSGFRVQGHPIRYQYGYDAMRDLARSCGAKVRIRYDGSARKAAVSAVMRGDYSKDGIDGDSIRFRIVEKRVVNHVIGLGKGEGASRIVAHRYMDADGIISSRQSLFGVAHIEEIYDSPNSELSELVEGMDKRLKEHRETSASCSIKDATSGNYDIGDIVGGTSTLHNLSLVTEVAQKVAEVTPKRIDCATKTAQEVR